MRKILLITSSIAGISATMAFGAGGFSTNYGTNGWVGDGNKSFNVTNNTPISWVFDGIRFVSTNGPKTSVPMQEPAGPISPYSQISSGYQMMIASHKMPLAITAASSQSFSSNWVSGTNGATWTPSKEQYLIKAGSWAGFKIVDSSVIKVTDLKKISDNSWFYDKNLYIPDSLGIRGGDSTGGFIDSWWDQQADSAVWQIQLFQPDRATTHSQLWNTSTQYNVGSMGGETSKGRYAGTGPFYAMALAMAQQYVHVDMQLLMAQGVKESQAGTGRYIPSNSPDGGTTGNNINGTMHWIDPSYNSYVHAAFPKFFPYKTTAQEMGGRFYINTPGYPGPGLVAASKEGNTVGNCPQMANTMFISAIYMMYDYKKISRATSYYAKKFYADMKDKEVGAKVFAWAWNGGPNSGYQDVFKQLSPTADDLRTASVSFSSNAQMEYIRGVFHQIDEFDRMNNLAATKNANGTFGDASIQNYIYDANISLWQIEEFLYGTDTTVSDGTKSTLAANAKLGAGGLLWHFKLSTDERNALWKDVVTAFDILKGKALSKGISTAESDKITYRYDWLAILRVIQGHLDIDVPTPQDEESKNWIEQNSKDTVTAIQNLGLENVYPYFSFDAAKGRVIKGDTLILTYTLEDETYINFNETPTVEWTADPNWGGWKGGVKTFGSTDFKKATYEIRILKDEIEKITGIGGSVPAWVRGYDRNFNAVVDTFSLYWVVPKEPVLDSASAIDTTGDGFSDAIQVHLTKSAAVDGDALSSFTKAQYSWPTSTSLVVPATATVNDTILTMKDNGIKSGSGLGLAQIDYPSKAGLSTTVSDRVSPAANFASLSVENKSRPNDSLKLVITEKIKTLDKTDFAYLKFYDVESKSGKSIASQKVIMQGDTTIFVFAANEIADQDSVKLIFDSGIFDEVDNKPAINTIYVPLKTIGGREPVVTFAAVFDKNGDGKADSGAVKLTLGSATNALTLDSTTSKQESWPSVNTLITMGNYSRMGTDSCTFVPNSTTGEGKGRVLFSFKGFPDVEGELLDLVGPAIVNDPTTPATYTLPVDTASTKTYILELTVSESIGALTDNKQYLEFRKGTAGSGTVISIPVSKSIGSNKWQFIFTANDLSGFDHVRIIPNGDLKDNASTPNKAQLNNQWVPFTTIDPNNTPTVDRATLTFEQAGTAEGNGDRLTVVFTIANGTDPITAKNIKQVRWNWNGKADSSSSVDTATVGKTVTLKVNNLDLQGYGSGTGDILFEKNGKSEIVGFTVIQDSVGPAIKKATCFRASTNGAPDTLELEVSEPLGSMNSGDYINRYLNGEHGSQSTISVQAFAGSATTYRGEITANSLNKNDWINFTVNKGVTDAVSNAPLDSNKRVPLIIVGSINPSVSSAEMFDANGDGNVDSVEIKILAGTDPDADDAYDLEKGKYSWPSKSSLLDPSQISKKDSGTIVFSGFSESSTAGEGLVALTFPSGEITGNLIDKAGPVLKSAKLYENESGEDTLLVTFSEPVEGLRGSAELLNIEKSAKWTNSVTQVSATSWLFTFDESVNVQIKQKVMIKSDASVRDTLKNDVHPNNIEVIIEEILRPIAIIADKSGFFDTDANGEMDHLKITLKKSVTQNRIKDFSVKFNWPVSSIADLAEFSVTSAEMVADTNSQIIIDLKSKSFLNGMTSIDRSRFGSITVTQPDDLPSIHNVETTFDGNDSMAAVLVGAAEYRGIKLSEDLDEFDDTLKVSFSEEIQQLNFGASLNDSVFTIKTEDGEFQMTVTGNSTGAGSTITIPVHVKRNGSVIPAYGDSIKISGFGKITDVIGNAQNSTETPYVPFTTVVLPAEYEVLVYPNPFTVRSETSNELLDQVYNMGGLVVQAIIVRPFGNRVGENLSGSISLFDALGNTIVANESFELTKGILLYKFDGKNQAGRSLGSGIYQAILNVTSKNGETEQQDAIPVKIGIKQ